MADALGPSASGVPPRNANMGHTELHAKMSNKILSHSEFVDIPHAPASSMLTFSNLSGLLVSTEVDDGEVERDLHSLPTETDTDFRTERNDAAEGRLRQLEDEHDALNTSLISLSTQFAQVQFRLKQLNATTSADEREALLKELEQVAFEGCPDFYGATQLLREEQQKYKKLIPTVVVNSEPREEPTTNTVDDIMFSTSDEEDDDELLTGVNNHRSKSLGSARSQRLFKKQPPQDVKKTPSNNGFEVEQKRGGGTVVQPSKSGNSNSPNAEAGPVVSAEDERRRLEMVETINKLKKQVEDLETLAYQRGHTDAPSSKFILERQKEVIDQLRSRLNIKVGEGFEKLTKVELRNRLDAAIGNVIIPIKEREVMLEQLLHQVKDLERFIDFLQTEGTAGAHTNQPVAGGGSVLRSTFMAGNNDAVIKPAGSNNLLSRAKGLRLERQPTTGEFNSLNYAETSANVSGNAAGDISITNGLPSQFNAAGPDNSNTWISTVASKSHAILHVLSYMLICGSREQQQASFLSEEQQRRASLAPPFSPVVTDAPVYSTFHSRNTVFRSNQLKATPAGSHWGDERAVLELAIGRVQDIFKHIGIVRNNKKHSKLYRSSSALIDGESEQFYCGNLSYGADDHYSSDSEAEEMVESVRSDSQAGFCAMVRCVRRELAPALMALMMHGCASDRLRGRSDMLRSAVMFLPGVAFSCVPHLTSFKFSSLAGSKSSHGLSSLKNSSEKHAAFGAKCGLESSAVRKSGTSSDVSHPWHLITGFYNLKDGAAYNRSASKKLADAFALPSASGTRAVTSRETLLAVIGDIVESHSKLKRSLNSHFKAFVCAGLNGRVLASWLRLIYGTDKLVEANYEPWSYAARTHFSDALISLDQLSALEFNLPVDFAVRRLQNLNDGF